MTKTDGIVGQNVAKRRKNIGIKQAELAERVEVVVETIGRLERGHSQPSFAKMCEIAAALGTDLGALSAGAESGPHADAVDKLTAIARARSVQDIELLIETARIFFRRLDGERRSETAATDAGASG